MGAPLQKLIRKQIKSTQQDGYATYDKLRRQNTAGTPLTRPIYPSGDELGFSG